MPFGIGGAALEKLTVSGAGPASDLPKRNATGGRLEEPTKLMRRILLTPTVPVVSETAEVDVVERAFGSLGQIHDVAVWPVSGSVGGLEIEHAVDVAVRIERQTLDPVLRVVGEEVASLVAAGELVPW